ncbi:glycosyltransferase family 4 protein [Falsiroseomonas oryzae]|uniref:glycosyltransferase family 4 protein n=1 Tax=Falsiroseomonas oryzae TaxID=2766473 RepID=UPI0022EBA308|nr:glycosyltransferase family 1 protein [Roseomonas sp. MO-31]
MTPLDPRPRLTLDIAPLLESQWTGIPVFTRRLVQALEASGRVRLDFAVRLNRVPEEAVRQAIGQGSGTLLRTGLDGPGAEEPTPVDGAVPLLYPSVKQAFRVAQREASTIHDISTLVMPETHAEANVDFHLGPLREQLLSDEAVFCCSEATRSALVATFPWVRPKARLVTQYVDWPAEFELYERNLPPVALGRYAVVVGTIEPRKNLGLLLRALEHPALARSGIHFVVIGRRGWLADQALAGLGPEARDRVTFTGFVSEFVKYRLLKHAAFMVFPSVYEGFGIPAVEAMSLGKPVLAAMTSAFPEVIGEAGVYFDPFSVEEFVAGLREIAEPKRLAELSPKALAQAATFGPERMAAPVLDWLAG